MEFTDVKFYLPIKFLAGKLPGEKMYENLAMCHAKFFDKSLKNEEVTLENELWVN